MKSVKLASLLLSLAVPAISIAQPPEGRNPQGRNSEGRNPERRQEGQEREGREGERGGRSRFPNPLLDALDKDKNGELSAEEIENATAALKTLDKNGDGKLDEVETRPNFEAMGRGGFGMMGPGPGPGGEGAGGAGNANEMVTRLMAMDANKDGKLSKDEIPERLQSMMSRGDKNEDGALDKEEIMAVARERAGSPGGQGGPGIGGPQGFRGGAGGDMMAQMMERADANKDRKLTGDEIPPFMRERISQIDTNNDGELDKAELEAGAARMRQGRGEGQGQGQGRGRGQRPPVEDDDDKKLE